MPRRGMCSTVKMTSVKSNIKGVLPYTDKRDINQDVYKIIMQEELKCFTEKYDANLQIKFLITDMLSLMGIKSTNYTIKFDFFNSDEYVYNSAPIDIYKDSELPRGIGRVTHAYTVLGGRYVMNVRTHLMNSPDYEKSFQVGNGSYLVCPCSSAVATDVFMNNTAVDTVDGKEYRKPEGMKIVKITVI